MSGFNLGFLLGGVVVVVVAVLLVTILVVARKIESLAATALEVAGTIESATQPIWSLGPANGIVEQIARAVRGVEEKVGAIADALTGGGKVS